MQDQTQNTSADGVSPTSWMQWLTTTVTTYPRATAAIVVAVIILIYLFVQYRSSLSGILAFESGGADKEKQLDNLINTIKSKQKAGQSQAKN
jgi:hypothetical protein